MAATNINVVVLTGNLTRDPELRSLPSGMSVCSLRIASNTRRKDQVRRVGGQAQLLRRHRLGRPGRELRALPLQGPPGRARRPPRVARVAGAGRPRSARASRSSPTPSSSSAAATRPRAAAAASPRSPTSRSTTATSSRRAHLRAAAARPRGRRHPVLGVERLTRSTASEHRSGAFAAEAVPEHSAGARRGASATMDRPRPPARADSCAPAAPRDTQHTKGLRKWQSSAAGRRAGVTRRVGPAPAAASPASTARTRSTTSITRTSPPSASSSATGARSARGVSPAPAAGTRTRSRPPSSGRARSRCSRTSATRARPRRARPAAARRSRPRQRPLAAPCPRRSCSRTTRRWASAARSSTSPRATCATT